MPDGTTPGQAAPLQGDNMSLVQDVASLALTVMTVDLCAGLARTFGQEGPSSLASLMTPTPSMPTAAPSLGASPMGLMMKAPELIRRML